MLFPKPMREFKGQRGVRIGVRTWHLLSMGYLLGGTAAGLSLAGQQHALWHTLASGLVFTLLELYASCIWLFQLKGQAVILKILLLGSALLSSGSGMPYLIAAVVIGGISSHMPGRFRYYSLYHGRLMKE